MNYNSSGAYVIQLLINFSVYLFFILNAFQGKIKYRPWINKSLILGYVFFSIIAITIYMSPYSQFPQHKYLALVIWLISTVLTSLLVLRSNLLQLLFFISVILYIQFNIMQVSEIIRNLNLLPCLFIGSDFHLLLINILVLLAAMPAMWYLFIGLFKKVINLNIDMSYWKYLFLIPLSAYLYCIFSMSNYSPYLESNFEVTLLSLLLLNIFGFLSYVVVLKMLIKTNDNLLSTEKSNTIQQQLFIQNEQYKKLAENIHQTERLQHDMRHHFITLKGYVEKQNFEGADIYLDNFIGKSLEKAEKPICENHSVDMILRHYIALAQAIEGVQVDASIELPNSFQFSDTDLCVIFGNLMENAVESCKKQSDGRRFITIKVKVISESILAITVANSYDTDIEQSGNDFISSKHEGIGIGTYSIRRIAESSGGSCEFSFKNSVFKASVLLVS